MMCAKSICSLRGGASALPSKLLVGYEIWLHTCHQTRESHTPSSRVPSGSGKKSYQGWKVCENQPHRLTGRILPQFTIQFNGSCTSHLHCEWNSGKMWQELSRGAVHACLGLPLGESEPRFSTNTGGLFWSKLMTLRMFTHIVPISSKPTNFILFSLACLFTSYLGSRPIRSGAPKSCCKRLCIVFYLQTQVFTF